MKMLAKVLLGSSLLVMAACVTINVYFPAAAAERAAEEFVEDVLGAEGDSGQLYPAPGMDRDGTPGPVSDAWLTRLAGGLLDWVVPSAQAQQASIDINTPQINTIRASMAQRQRQHLNAWFDAGAIGFSNDGFVSIRDRAAVPLNERRSLEAVVAEENRERAAVYREIAVANGHPEWERDIQKTFAAEWVRNARPGWYFQDAAGNWQQK